MRLLDFGGVNMRTIGVIYENGVEVIKNGKDNSQTSAEVSTTAQTPEDEPEDTSEDYTHS